MIKKIIKYIGIIIILLILFRGFLYRTFINYSKIEIRDNIKLTNLNLIKEIDIQIENQALSIEDIIILSNRITSDKLNFTFDKVSSNPNLSYEFKKGNCIGYSSMFNSIGNYILEKQKMNKNYKFSHLVGKLYVLGFDIHNIFNNPFFINHDYNRIVNKKTGEKKFVDPSLRDYLRIEYVTSK